MPCCSCDGKNVVCKRCACACTGTPCQNCLPLQMKCCCNTLSSPDDSQSNSSGVLFNQNSDQSNEPVDGHLSLVADNAKYDLCVNESQCMLPHFQHRVAITKPLLSLPVLFWITWWWLLTELHCSTLMVVVVALNDANDSLLWFNTRVDTIFIAWWFNWYTVHRSIKWRA